MFLNNTVERDDRWGNGMQTTMAQKKSKGKQMKPYFSVNIVFAFLQVVTNDQALTELQKKVPIDKSDESLITSSFNNDSLSTKWDMLMA